MKYVSKKQWGANPSKEATEDSHPIGSTLGVTLHWVGPGMGYPWAHSSCDDKVRGIERHHEYGNGWGDIAYNLLVCPHGYVFEGRGVGVRSAANGGTQSNEDWYAVCYLGGLGDGFSPDGSQAMRAAVTYLRNKGNAGPRVNGHRDHKGTDCPGDTIYRWLNATDFDPRSTQSEEDDDMAFLDEPLNVHDPRGRKETQNVTVREALTASVIRTLHGEDAAKVYLEQAQKSAATKE